MINSFLNKLLCTRCNKKIYINNVVYKKKRLINGTLICKNCKRKYKIINNVIDFSKVKHENINKIYNKYWNDLPIGFKRNIDSNEISIFQSIKSSLSNKIVFDAGCGDGRLIPTICKHKPKMLIVADFTDIIFYTAKKYFNKFNDIPIIFIKIDLADQFVKKNFIDSTITLGSINFKIKQSKIIKNLDLVSKDLLLIGLVSNISMLGKFYQSLNPIRYIFKLKIFKVLILIMKFIILNTTLRKIKIIFTIGNYFYSLLEFLISPIIVRHNNDYYKKYVKKNKITIYTNKLLDYLVFKS